MAKNAHISCMCILHKQQSHGYSKVMLNKVEQITKPRNMKTLSLDTEIYMKTFNLYEKYEFKNN